MNEEMIKDALNEAKETLTAIKHLIFQLESKHGFSEETASLICEAIGSLGDVHTSFLCAKIKM